jgi:hypothetical protein
VATRQEFAAVMAYLGSAVGKEPTREQAEVYFDLLGDLPTDALQLAAKRAALEHKIATLPPAGLIREHAAALAAKLPRPVAESWQAVSELAGRLATLGYLPERGPIGRFLDDSEQQTRRNPERMGRTELQPFEQARLDRIGRIRQRLDALGRVAVAAADAYGWRAIVDTDAGIAFAHFRQLYESLDKPTRQEAALPPPLRTGAAAAIVGSIGKMPALGEAS